LDIKAEFDAKYFMPYAAGYCVSGPSDLVLFRIDGSSDDGMTAPSDGKAQVEALISKLTRVMTELGGSFEDVVLAWNRVEDLDTHEEAILMTRGKLGLTRPLSESVLEIAAPDSNGTALDGVPIIVEYIVVAQVPRRGTTQEKLSNL
jgi:hypothetical protein